MMFIGFLLTSITMSLFLFFYINTFFFIEMKNFLLFSQESLNIKLTSVNFLFFLLVMFISFLVYMYSMFYMGTENKMLYFFYWTLFFFLSSMLFLILSEDMMLMMLGWDGLGVSSFLLVIFYNNMFSFRAGMATFITNRLGDMFIIISLINMYSMGIINVSLFNIEMLNNMDKKLLNYLFLIFLLLGCSTKSAQLPFSAWLPAAMAAPTPISSLVHSSTLVTAGIFVLTHFSWTFFSLPQMNLVVGLFSLMLSILSGLMAFYEVDFKKLIAMSTLSQLGLLLYTLSLNSINLTMYHIMSHALFKSALFMTLGAFIILNTGYQDMRIKSSYKKNFFFLKVFFIFCSFSLMGFPFTSGFFSKDMILLESSLNGVNFMMEMMLIISCLMTVLYTINSLIMLFNNTSLSQNYMQYNINFYLILTMLITFPITIYFGKYIFFSFLNYEYYTYSYNKKILGMKIIFWSLFIYILIYYYKFYTPVKYLYKYFLTMSNMNWISNNNMTNTFKKNFFLMVIEMLWWEKITSMAYYNFSKTFFSHSNLKYLKFKSLMLSILLMFFLFLMMLFA